MKFTSLLIGIILFGIVATSLIYFAVLLADENELENKITDDPSISRTFGNLTKQLNESGKTATNQTKSFVEEGRNPTWTTIEFIFSSVLSGVDVFLGSVINMFRIITDLAVTVFEVNPMIVGSLSAILLIVLLFSGWRLIHAGE